MGGGGWGVGGGGWGGGWGVGGGVWGEGGSTTCGWELCASPGQSAGQGERTGVGEWWGVCVCGGLRVVDPECAVTRDSLQWVHRSALRCQFCGCQHPGEVSKVGHHPAGQQAWPWSAAKAVAQCCCRKAQVSPREGPLGAAVGSQRLLGPLVSRTARHHTSASAAREECADPARACGLVGVLRMRLCACRVPGHRTNQGLYSGNLTRMRQSAEYEAIKECKLEAALSADAALPPLDGSSVGGGSGGHSGGGGGGGGGSGGSGRGRPAGSGVVVSPVALASPVGLATLASPSPGVRLPVSPSPRAPSTRKTNRASGPPAEGPADALPAPDDADGVGATKRARRDADPGPAE